MYYFGARYLGPKTGHFVTVDPVGAVDEKTGKANEKLLLNPQKIHRYAYAINNPYRYVDPDGAMATEIGVTVGTFIAPGPGTAIGGVAGAAIDAGIGLIVGYGVDKIGEAIYNKATDNNEDAGPKEGSAPGQTASGQATDKYGNKLGPSGKQVRHKVEHSSKKGANDAANQEGP